MATSTLRKTLEESATAFFHSYEDASRANDASIVSRGMTENCTRKFQPPTFCQAMGYPEDVEIPSSVYQGRIAQGMQHWTATKTEILHLTVDVDARQVAAQTAVSGKWSDGEDVKLHFAWFLYFSDDGTQISRVIEYMDSPPTKAYYGKIQALSAAAQA
ncbi:hypothetical protein UA08_04084 [Talaromyces atroroseus]|uniref:SnoaL-like domain-containing protein n=1 Tax=Talaromyces atroroseus TaxID=1441469 RepID=A0A1Q5Q932_TALAT|nr:hypothetical protein UA08_04084 [Talaromyces atroroseus]OKL60624.1 hypothetical protein UA08_04084 [Talaromyces atroroseus]